MVITIHQLRKAAVNEEIDYLFLQDQLKEYANPRDKITAFLRANQLIRIKKGLYVFGPEVALHPYCKETLANIIYGPSAISLEYALGFYGMIPERVETVTSVTNKRDKFFATTIGNFSYRYLHPKKYAVGITLQFLDETHAILIATREKALVDVLVLTPKLQLRTLQALQDYVLDNLRIEQSSILSLQIPRLQALADAYRHRHVDLLLRWVEAYGE